MRPKRNRNTTYYIDHGPNPRKISLARWGKGIGFPVEPRGQLTTLLSVLRRFRKFRFKYIKFYL